MRTGRDQDHEDAQVERRRIADVWEGHPTPADYLTMVEFEELPSLQGGVPHANVKPEILFVYGPKVFDHCLTVPADTHIGHHVPRTHLPGSTAGN